MRIFFRVLRIAIILGLVFFIGFSVGRATIPAVYSVQGLTSLEEGKPVTVSFEPFWKAWNVINEHYAPTEEVATEDKVWGAIQGLADSLGDPYTVFMPPEETKIFEELINGSFGGVGMEIGEREGFITVIAPLKGTPADLAGIHAGDIVASINGTSTAGMNVDDAVGLIRGEEGTVVTLEVLRDGHDDFLTFDIIRDIIVIPTLDTETRGDTFIISLYNFDANAPSEFRKAMNAFVASNADNLILDVRGNPGGFLDAAVDIASYFVPAGDIIVEERYDGDDVDDVVHRSRGYVLRRAPARMVVLVDEGSASASEIVAGALQEHDVATLVGAQTFGKGSVQELIPITSDTALKLTVAQWLTPEGNSISDGGLTPDVIVEASNDELIDLQLERALEIVSGGE